MLNKIKKLFKRDAALTSIPFKGLHLPSFRTNQDLGENEKYLNSGVEQIQFLKEQGILNAETSFLDFGCGQGRIANSFLFSKSEPGTYSGVDTDARSIEWCNKWIAPQAGEKFKFIHLPAFNARYNKKVDGLKKLPFEEEKFDLIFLNSVFSHMIAEDILFYLAEFRRVLNPNGAIYMTAFVEENVPEFEENPQNYLGKSTGALHRVRFEKNYFFSLVEKADLKVEGFFHQQIERTHQSVIIARKG